MACINPIHHRLLRTARCPNIIQNQRQFITRRSRFSTSLPAMVKAEELKISPGEDLDAVVQQTTELVDDGKWQLCNNGKGLERPFKFKTFKATWDFMNQVASECKKAKHHPEWSNVYNKTQIRWTTHSPEGLSSKDTRMAKFCDEAAKEFGELGS